MFEFVVIFLFLILSAVGRSYKDKKKIEDSRRRRSVRIPNSQKPIEYRNVESQKETRTVTFDEPQTRTSDRSRTTISGEPKKSTINKPRTEAVDDPKTVMFEDAEVFSDNEESNDKKDRYYENIFEDIDSDYGKSHDIQIEVLDKRKGKTRYNYKNLEKDVLKGIIFSEILSEPKSIKNRKSY